MLIPLLASLILTLAPPDTSPDPAAPPERSTPALIADLASSSPDPRPRNALQSLISRGEPALPSLTAALTSPDFRQRQLAAAALRTFYGFAPEGDQLPVDDPVTPLSTAPVSDALIRITIEGLKHDSLPGSLSAEGESGNKPIVYNAAGGTRFLIKHIARAEPQLTQALKSSDLQQHFCAAVILAFSHRTAHAETICSILIPHLRDNSIPCDALWAACALYRLGPAADLHLQAAALKPIDKQQRELLALILLDIRKPLPRPDDYGPRATGKLTTLDLDGTDPVIAFDQNSLRMDWGSMMTEHNRDTPLSRPLRSSGEGGSSEARTGRGLSPTPR